MPSRAFSPVSSLLPGQQHCLRDDPVEGADARAGSGGLGARGGIGKGCVVGPRGLQHGTGFDDRGDHGGHVELDAPQAPGLAGLYFDCGECGRGGLDERCRLQTRQLLRGSRLGASRVARLPSRCREGRRAVVVPQGGGFPLLRRRFGQKRRELFLGGAKGVRRVQRDVRIARGSVDRRLGGVDRFARRLGAGSEESEEHQDKSDEGEGSHQNLVR